MTAATTTATRNQPDERLEGVGQELDVAAVVDKDFSLLFEP